MARPPVLVPHQVTNEDAIELRDALAERLPDVEVRVAHTPGASREAISDAGALLTWDVTDEQLAAAASLGWVQSLSAGVEHYDLDALREAGIVLTSGAGLHAEPIAQQVLCYLLAFERDLPRALRQQRRGAWEKFRPGELGGKTLAVVGLGAIGGRVAELASAFGVTVVGTKRDPSEAPDAADEVYGPEGVAEILPRADYLLVACPLTEATRGLLGADELAMLPRRALVVNVARGPIVDQSALVDALRDGELRGAALDVFEAEPLPDESPLWDLSNAVVTPHNAGWGEHTFERAADLFADNYRAFAAGEEDRMKNRVTAGGNG